MIKKLGLLLLLVAINLVAKSHEGMWIPALLKSLNEPEMKAFGLKLSAEDIYSVNQSSLKDAIVHFGGFCTGEIISDKGLVLTNHHCGYGAIQSHSSVENDYLSDGFWAANHKEELKNDGLFVTFIVSIEDVTAQAFAGTEGLENPDPVVRKNVMEITTKANEEKGIEAFVRAFYYGNQYFLIKTKSYKDIRLVGAPPSSVGKYGGDTDNWVWPRHTGDFSLFRIYADKNNEPAEYSEDNVPFTPKKHLPISLQGSDDGEFAMVYGFPGRTEHFLSSYQVEHVINDLNPARIAMRDASLEVINKARAADAKTRIQYASKQSSIANAWKKWKGQSRGLKMFNALDKKRAFEEEFEKRAAAKGKTEYQGVLEQFKELQQKLGPVNLARANFIELAYVSSELFRYVRGYDQMLTNYQGKVGDEKIEEDKKKLLNSLDAFFKDYDAKVDRDILAAQMLLFNDLMPDEYKPEWAKPLNTQAKVDAFLDNLYSKTAFTNPEKLKLILSASGDKGLKKLLKDPAYVATMDLFTAYFSKIAPEYQALTGKEEALMKVYVAGILELFPELDHWPDANSTLRLSYGKVEGSSPNDAVIYQPQTTMDGLMAKYIPGDRDFDLPERLINLGEKKDFGQYANADGELVVCFTSSNHTSGGNSGSPVINGKGELIGLNFDRSWESTMSDIMFDPSICRNIAVDIRYVLFIVDKYAGAKHLIEEMDLIVSNNKMGSAELPTK